MIPQIKTSSRRGFTLIELLVVISIIGVLAAFSVVSLKTISKTRKISVARGELAQVAAALENYKAKYGAYPPGNGANTTTAALTNQLFYELSGTTINAGGNFQTLDSSATIAPLAVKNIYNVGGFLNCTKGGGEDTASAKNFILSLKPNQIGSVFYNNGIPATNLVTAVGGPDDTYLPVGVKGVNPIRYMAPGPTNNNAGSYDLWVQLQINGKKYLVCNWSKAAQVNNPMP